MGLFSSLFKKKKPKHLHDGDRPKTSGELIAETTEGANLVDGRQTWEQADVKKHDIEHMKRCCDAELKTMEKTGLVPAPYYFERVAILSRKQKDYKQEIYYCEIYIEKVESIYANDSSEYMADVRRGPRYQALVKRLPKAKELYAKQNI